MNRSAPPNTVIPIVRYPDVVAATHWLCDAFGFTPRVLIADHRAQLNVGTDGAVIVGDGGADVSACRCGVMVRVNDIDAHFEHAVRNGAVMVYPPEDYPYGERQYMVEDFAGHRWTFTQTISDVAPEDWGGTTP
jgi:uncharacterized glyoxalase superfamily protein PhnB